MGDRIAVMKDGIIQQIDEPSIVYDIPSNQFVGGFIDNPPMNFMAGQVQRDNGQVNVQIGDFSLDPAPSMKPKLKPYDGQQVAIGIRAENMETLNTPTDDALKVRVLVVEPLGSQNLLTVNIGDDTVKVATHPIFQVKPDDDVWLRFPADKIRWFDRDSGLTLYP
jgi:multiple sugar transport system ATP-binding protein